MNQIDLGGRGAVVTGGAQGIGLAVARRLLASGAKVALWDRDAKLLDETIASLGRDGVVASGEVVDVTDPAATAKTAERTSRQLGGIDILVNNAGIAGRNGNAVGVSRRRVARVIDIDLTGVFYCCRAVVPHDAPRTTAASSTSPRSPARRATPTPPPTAPSKAGVIALTKSLGKELAGHDIAVNCITPAAAKTAHLRADDAAAHRLHAGEDPAGPFRRGREIAAMVAWLASAENSFTTGAVFDISGGRATY